jgi:hypothetical protein
MVGFQSASEILEQAPGAPWIARRIGLVHCIADRSAQPFRQRMLLAEASNGQWPQMDEAKRSPAGAVNAIGQSKRASRRQKTGQQATAGTKAAP